MWKRKVTATMPAALLSRLYLVPHGIVTLAAVFALSFPSVAAAQTPPTPPSVPALPSVPTPPIMPLAVPLSIDEATGVGIYSALDDETFPVSWRGGTIAASATPTTPVEAERVRQILLIALRKYPAAFVRANLERIYIVGTLRFQGISAAGTNSATRIYLRVVAGNARYTDTFLEESFHHEFAHMLRRNFMDRWNAAAWTACNPFGFQYGSSSGVEAIRNGKTALALSDEWNQRGFLSEYATSDMSEDFATVGGNLFTGDASFWATVDHFPALLAKLRVGMGFYQKMDPAFSENYFRSLRAGVVPPPAAPFTPPPPTPVSPLIGSGTTTIESAPE